MAEKSYWAEKYWEQLGKPTGYAFSIGPEASIFTDPIFGKNFKEFQPGRILLPFDFLGWFADGFRKIWNPSYGAPAPVQPEAPKKEKVLPRYALICQG